MVRVYVGDGDHSLKWEAKETEGVQAHAVTLVLIWEEVTPNLLDGRCAEFMVS